MRYDPTDPNADFSPENLQRLISTMNEWSMKRPWTPEQTAAWRLRMFGRTPADDVRALEVMEEYERYGSDEPRRWEPPEINYPNGQGTYD
jgi:hypothetical protein